MNDRQMCPQQSYHLIVPNAINNDISTLSDSTLSPSSPSIYFDCRTIESRVVTDDYAGFRDEMKLVGLIDLALDKHPSVAALESNCLHVDVDVEESYNHSANSYNADDLSPDSSLLLLGYAPYPWYGPSSLDESASVLQHHWSTCLAIDSDQTSAHCSSQASGDSHNKSSKWFLDHHKHVDFSSVLLDGVLKHGHVRSMSAGLAVDLTVSIHNPKPHIRMSVECERLRDKLWVDHRLAQNYGHRTNIVNLIDKPIDTVRPKPVSRDLPSTIKPSKEEARFARRHATLARHLYVDTSLIIPADIDQSLSAPLRPSDVDTSIVFLTESADRIDRPLHRDELVDAGCSVDAIRQWRKMDAKLQHVTHGRAGTLVRPLDIVDINEIDYIHRCNKHCTLDSCVESVYEHQLAEMPDYEADDERSSSSHAASSINQSNSFPQLIRHPINQPMSLSPPQHAVRLIDFSLAVKPIVNRRPIVVACKRMAGKVKKSCARFVRALGKSLRKCDDFKRDRM